MVENGPVAYDPASPSSRDKVFDRLIDMVSRAYGVPPRMLTAEELDLSDADVRAWGRYQRRLWASAARRAVARMLLTELPTLSWHNRARVLIWTVRMLPELVVV